MANWKPLLTSLLLRSPTKRGFLSTLPKPLCCSTWRMEGSRQVIPPRVEKHFKVCPTCQGMGKVARPPSKKQRLRYKRKLGDAHGSNCKLPPNHAPCAKCTSSGLQRVNEKESPPCSLDAMSAKPDGMQQNTSLPDVAIIGGGLGGLALSAALRHRGIKHTVYERDKSFHERSQGYGLTMQQASKALRGFGIETLTDGITSKKHLVHQQDGTVVGEWGLKVWGRSSSKSPPKRQNVHIARQSLRWQLYEVAGDSSVQWGHRLERFDRRSDGKIQMELHVEGKGSVVRTADILVGADGIRSQVREQLIGEARTPLRYLGCIVILGICKLEQVPPELRQTPLLDGETVFQTADGTTRIYMMPFTDTEYMWQLSFPMAELDAESLSRRGPDGLLFEAVSRCSLWHEPVAAVLKATRSSDVSGYPVYDRELVELGMFAEGITLIGDAAVSLLLICGFMD